MGAVKEEPESMEGEIEEERKEGKEGSGEREREVGGAMMRKLPRAPLLSVLGALKRRLGVGEQLFWPGWRPQSRAHLPSS